MNDELNFLRWCYRNAQRFDSALPSYRVLLNSAYERETPFNVPNDYRGTSE